MEKDTVQHCDEPVVDASSINKPPVEKQSEQDGSPAPTAVEETKAANVLATCSSDPPVVKMTKSGLKKMRRLERMMDKRKEKKERKKQLKRERAIASGRDLEQERKEMEARAVTGDGRRIRQANWDSKMEKCKRSDFQVAIDCAFEESMTYKEINSLSQQLRYCYATNKRSPRPCLLAATSIGGTTLQLLQKVNGYDSWGNRAFTITNKSLEEYYQSRLSDLVYLTSDAERVLDKLDDGKIYIIGGIVDRNRLKKAALTRAQMLGVATAKLPLDDFMQMEGATPILTCNHVFDILMHFKEHSNWQEALISVLPQRKGAKPAQRESNASSPPSSSSEVDGKADVLPKDNETEESHKGHASQAEEKSELSVSGDTNPKTKDGHDDE